MIPDVTEDASIEVAKPVELEIPVCDEIPDVVWVVVESPPLFPVDCGRVLVGDVEVSATVVVGFVDLAPL